jgi:uncharacterized protein (DUF4415 family)
MTYKGSPERQALRDAIEALPPLTDEEEAHIQAGIASDPDNPELTDEQIAVAKPCREVFPVLHASIKRSRGRPRIISPKEAVTLRLSPETIARFKEACGDDWRARMSETLERATG